MDELVLPQYVTDPNAEPVRDDGLETTDPNLKAIEGVDTGASAAICQTVVEKRAALAEIKKTPSSWEECHIDSPEDGAKIIDFEKAIEFLKTKKKIANFSPELKLALSDNPVKTGPFGLEMQSFPIGKKEEKRMVQNNLMFLFKLGIIESGFPKEHEEDINQFTKVIAKKYKKNLGTLRKEHKEIETRGGKFSVQDIIRKFNLVETLDMDGDNEKVALARFTYDEAETVAHEKTSSNTRSEGGSIEERSARVPISFFKKEKKEVILRLLVLLDSLGEIDLGEMSGDELLDIFQILKWSNYKTSAFLEKGESKIIELQKKMRSDKDTEDLDKAKFVKTHEIRNFYELLRFAMSPKHSVDWRNQAILRAFSKLKFVRIRSNTEYRNAEESAEAMAEARESFPFERDENGDLKWVDFTFYENRHGDRSMKKINEFNIETSDQARIWNSPVSGIRYGAYFFGKNPIKDKLVVALKGHIKNSAGNPEKLLDIVRDGIVIYPIDENGERRTDVDPKTLAKDKMYFLYTFLKKIILEDLKTHQEIGISMAQKNPTINLNNIDEWKKFSAQEIYNCFAHREPALNNSGMATIEDTQLREYSNHRSNPLFNCMKLLLRMPDPLRTGCEFQALDPEDYCEITSRSSSANHEVYEDVRSLELHGNFYPGQYFPGTQLTNQALKLSIDIRHFEYMYRKKEDDRYKQEAELLERKMKILTRIRKDIEGGKRGGHCNVALAANDDMYEIAEINQQIENIHKSWKAA